MLINYFYFGEENQYVNLEGKESNDLRSVLKYDSGSRRQEFLLFSSFNPSSFDDTQLLTEKAFKIFLLRVKGAKKDLPQNRAFRVSTLPSLFLPPPLDSMCVDWLNYDFNFQSDTVEAQKINW